MTDQTINSTNLFNCPKCNHAQIKETTECEKCGIIFSKFNPALNLKPVQDISESLFSLKDLLFYTPAENNPVILYSRLAILVVLILWGIRFITSPIQDNYAGRSFMHLVNLPFHEAGHILFRPFGAFITSLGGTLGQLIMPLICFCVLLIKTRDTFGASVTLWWFGQNFFDIAPYVNDARSLTMPLVGGNFGHSSPYGFHDWEYLLTESGLLQYDHAIAKLCVVIGTVLFLLSFAWGAFLLFKQFKNRMTK